MRSTLAVLWILIVAGCSKDETSLGDRSVDGVPGELSLMHPGPHSLEVARRRAPEVVLIRTEHGYAGRVQGEENAEVTWIELKDESGDFEFRIEPSREGAPQVLTFELPHPLSGHLVARIHYVSGEIWRRAIDLR